MKGKPSNAGRSGNKAASSSSSSSSPWALKARERTLQKKKDDKATVTNPFDKFANNKKKHDVLNRKVKGEDRNVGRAREKVRVSFQFKAEETIQLQHASALP